jgi:hypothetical protein
MGSVPHENGVFFLGQWVGDPGPLFYPLAIGLRLTPWALVGCGLATVPLALGRLDAARRRTLLWLGVYGLLCLAMLTLAPKKFDRYALPIFPALDISAGIGLVWAAETAHAALARRGWHVSAPLVWALAVAGLALNLAWHQPYELAYYNPLLGGGLAAEHGILVGWGEGLELAADYINAQPGGCDRPVYAPHYFLLGNYTCAPTTDDRAAAAGYAVFYINLNQRNVDADLLTALRARHPPDHTVRINGIDYAYVYALDPPAP